MPALVLSSASSLRALATGQSPNSHSRMKNPQVLFLVDDGRFADDLDGHFTIAVGLPLGELDDGVASGTKWRAVKELVPAVAQEINE